MKKTFNTKTASPIKRTKRLDVLSNLEVGETTSFRATVIQEFRYNEESCWGAYLVELDSGERISINGDFHKALARDLDYEFKGTVGSFKGVNQIKVTHYKSIPPETRHEMVAFLKTLPGIKKTALGIYQLYGKESLDMLRTDPEKVVKEVEGLKLKSAKKAQEYLIYEVEGEDVILTLLGYGLGVKDAKGIYKASGGTVLDEIEQNPYVICQKVSGFSFNKCEKLAEEIHFDLKSAHRIQAGVLQILEESATKGHCFLPIPILLRETTKLLYRYDCPIYEADLHASVQDLINRQELILEKDRLYLRKFHEYERMACLELCRLIQPGEEYELSEVESALEQVLAREPNIVLEDRQREAVIASNLKKSGIFLLNGHAGTGKTFTLRLMMAVRNELFQREQASVTLKEGDSPSIEVVGILSKESKNVDDSPSDSKKQEDKKFQALYTAPTGKASKVMSRATGQPAHTIHRGLHYDAKTSNFNFNKNSQLPYDVLVCDETSMLDLWLFIQLTQAIKTGTKIIFIGDTHQLPSIGAGNILKDLLDSGIIDGVTLDVAKRQGLQSDILANANNIIAGRMIENYNRTNDAFFINRHQPTDIQETIINSIKELLTRPDFSLEEIQVLSPMRQGPLGTNMLNYLLQETFNPTDDPMKVAATTFDCRQGYSSKSERYHLFFKKGDKVINIKNMYDIPFCLKTKDGKYPEDENHEGDITNGECGIIEEIIEEQDEDTDKWVKKVIVKYEDGYIKYEPGDLDSLLHAYCLTVHKSQGSGWKAVLFPVHKTLDSMLENSSIYTAWTRAREYAACIGSPVALEAGIRTFRSSIRYTTLAPRVRYEFGKYRKPDLSPLKKGAC